VWIFSETREHQLSEAVFRAQNGALDGPKNSPNVKLRLELAVTFTGCVVGDFWVVGGQFAGKSPMGWGV
jgi:hypothetical protein